MSDWPTESIIRIDRGTLNGNSISGAIAGISPCDTYTLLTGRHQGSSLVQSYKGDSIQEWTPFTAVPTASIEALRQVFQGVCLSPNQNGALYGVTSYAPPTREGLINRAIAEAKKLPAASVWPLRGKLLQHALLQKSATSLPEFTWDDYVRIIAVAEEAMEGLEHCNDWDAFTECANDVPACDSSSQEYEELTAAIGRALARSDINSFIEVGGRALAYAVQSAQREAA